MSRYIGKAKYKKKYKTHTNVSHQMGGEYNKKSCRDGEGARAPTKTGGRGGGKGCRIGMALLESFWQERHTEDSSSPLEYV